MDGGLAGAATKLAPAGPVLQVVPTGTMLTDNEGTLPLGDGAMAMASFAGGAGLSSSSSGKMVWDDDFLGWDWQVPSTAGLLLLADLSRLETEGSVAGNPFSGALLAFGVSTMLTAVREGAPVAGAAGRRGRRGSGGETRGTTWGAANTGAPRPGVLLGLQRADSAALVAGGPLVWGPSLVFWDSLFFFFFLGALVSGAMAAADPSGGACPGSLRACGGSGSSWPRFCPDLGVAGSIAVESLGVALIFDFFLRLDCFELSEVSASIDCAAGGAGGFCAAVSGSEGSIARSLETSFRATLRR